MSIVQNIVFRKVIKQKQLTINVANLNRDFLPEVIKSWTNWIEPCAMAIHSGV